MLILLAVFVGLSCAFMATGAYFAYDALRKADQAAVDSRFALAVGRVVASVERAASYGITLPAQETLSELLMREAALEQEIRSIDVRDSQGRVLFSSDTARVGRVVVSPVPRDTSVDGLRHISSTIRDDLGQPIGIAEVLVDNSKQQASEQRLAEALRKRSWPALMLAGLGTLLGGLALMRYTLTSVDRNAGGRKRRWLVLGFGGGLSLITSFSLSLALLYFGLQAQHLGERIIAPDFADKARSVARSSATLVDVALEYGIPLEKLVGVVSHFNGVRATSPEIAMIELLDVSGRLLQRMDPDVAELSDSVHSASVHHDGVKVATVQVTLDATYIGRQLRATMIDIAFLAFVSLLIALELMALILGSGALRQLAWLENRAGADGSTAATQSSAGAIRPAVFVFMLAEEFTRPFLPSYARALIQDSSTRADLLASLPLVGFLAVVALCQIPFAALSERLGRREGFMLGSLVAAAGYALCAWVDSLVGFSLARLLSGLGFALVFVSGQGYVIDGSSVGDRARSLAVFIRAILVAGLCGPPLGGMISDQLGVPLTFAVCAGMCLLAFVALITSLPASTRSPNRAPASWNLGLRNVPLAWHAEGVRGLLLGCAFPAKLMLGALCFYLIPLELQRSGYSGAVIGRLQMIYPLLMVIFVPFFAALADRLTRRTLFVWLGGLLSGSCALLVLVNTAPVWVGAMLFILGLGQSMSISAQSAMVADLAERSNQQSAVLGLFRLVERSGSAIGPAAGAMLLGAFGFGPAVAAIGMVAIVGNVTYAVSSQRHMIRT